MHRSVFRLAFTLFLLTLLSGCLTDGGKNKSKPDGQAEVSIRLERVGSLSKSGVIEMQRLHVTFHAAGEDTVRDSIAVSGNAAQTVSKTYNGLKRGVSWTLTVSAKDIKGAVVYSGSQTFAMPASGTATVSLTLAAQYSMLEARFFPIYDSVTQVELRVDGMKVADSTFPKQSKLGDTVKVGYDYLSASTAGTSHAIRLAVYGLKTGGVTALLYRGDTTINVISGQDASHNITLYWVDSSSSPTGPAAITVSLGTLGKVRVNGTLEAGFEPLKWGKVSAMGFESASSYNGSNGRGQGLVISSTGRPYIVVTLNNGNLGVLRIVGSKWEPVGSAAGLAGSSPILLLDQNDTPFLVYYNGGFRAARVNGAQWDTLGAQVFSVAGYYGAALSSTGVLHIVNNNGLLVRWSGSKWDSLTPPFGQPTPYAFSLSKTNVPHMMSGNPAKLYRLNGTVWDTVGTGNLGSGGGSVQSLAFSASNQAYMIQQVNAGGIRVVRWTGSAYDQVGGVISDSSIASSSLAFFGDVPYIAFTRQGQAPLGSSNYHKTFAIKRNGSAWEYLGATGASTAFSPAGATTFPTMAIAPNGTPYVIYGHAGGAAGNLPMVLRYNLP